MDLTSLNSLLSDAHDVIDRSISYRDCIKKTTHPAFNTLIANYQSNSLQLENNPVLASIRVPLNESLNKMNNEDSAAINNIMILLDEAATSLALDGTMAQLVSTMQAIDSFYTETNDCYAEANDYYSAWKEISKQRNLFVLDDVGSLMYNFAMYFDIELQQDGKIVLFLTNTFLTLLEKLRVLKAKIAQRIATLSNIPPEIAIDSVTGPLGQSQDVIDDATETIQVLQAARSTLTELGQGLLKHEVNISTNTDLTEVNSALDNILSGAADKASYHDGLINQLMTYSTGFTCSASAEELESARDIAATRQGDSKLLHESAHLIKVGFNELDAFYYQLDAMGGTTPELAFYSDFRQTIDKLHLASLYIDKTLSKLEVSSGRLRNIFANLLEDQRSKVETLNDNLPFALLPVRLETRFMTIKHVRNNITYATFGDAIRSDQDVRDIKSTKSENTLKEFSPPQPGITLQTPPPAEMIPDIHELWVRIYPDVISIHTHEDPLSQSEINSAQVYWNENWLALGDQKLELGAWRVLCSAYGSQRAAWIVSQTTPTNSGSKPNVSTPQPHPTPSLPSLTPRPASWSQQPHTRVMPERFVARVYSNSAWREVVGQLVPSPLPVGFDPMDSYANYLDDNGNEINMPPDLRWLTNFEEAEKVGMGIRIPLLGNEITQGFDRLLVLGLKLDIDATASKQELETLLNNHHYSNGLALVPQGTPTNNTEEVKSGYASTELNNEESFATELGANLFTTTSSHFDKKDGQRLAEALGVNPSVFQHVVNSNTADVTESIAMNRALWPATLGYYLKNMLTPSLVQQNITDTKSFFTNYVQGRGLIPAIRVRNQPYGILTSTVFSRWTPADIYGYEAKLYNNVLDKLRKYWIRHFFPKVERISSDATTPPQDLLVRILGLHPSSLEFHQRITVGDVLASNIGTFLTAAGQPQPTPLLSNATAAGLLDAFFKSYQMEYFSYFNSPRIFGMAFATKERLLNGPVIDTKPLSEKRPIETLGNGYANYIEWLETSSISYIRAENYINPLFSPNQQQQLQPPKALLYLLLRHAWMLEYLETAHCLLTNANVISQDSWHNHELLKMANENTPESATEEQKQMLHGFVKAEVQYENELSIETRMRGIATDPEYLSSGMTPKQFQDYLRDQSTGTVEEITASRYGTRLSAYYVDQAQWSYLTNTFPEISPALTMEDYIRGQLNSNNPCFTGLNETFAGLIALKDLPTARLERCLAEHLDTCAYRLDSWLNGLVSKRLTEQRSASSTGIYLGAYGILEYLKPGEYKGVHVVNVSAADSWNSSVAQKGQKKILDQTPAGDYPTRNGGGVFVTTPQPATQPATFLYIGDDSSTELIEDPESGKIVSGQSNTANQGFILAPSLNHAVAAAVMRAGYKAHKDPTTPAAQRMAVTLTSDRVRTAMYYLDGIRQGQSLSSLLGYQFERGLHEQQATNPAIDGYIFELRARFPLVAGTVVNTTGGYSDNAEAQTRQVTDGLQLLEAYDDVANPWYASLTIAASIYSGGSYTADGLAIQNSILKIKADLDAIGDLLLSEAIYQVTRGNHERAGSVLQALGYGGDIPDPQITKTPRQADTFMHRYVVQLTPAVTANTGWTGSSYRADAEPGLNNWFASQLPAPADIRVVYDYTGNTSTLSVDMNDLGLQPIDLWTVFATSGNTQTLDATELSRRVLYYVRSFHNLSDSVQVTVSYNSRVGLASTQRTLFELTPIFKSLSRIVGSCRMLNPDDFITPGELSTISAPTGVLNSGALYTRINTAKSNLQTTATALNTAITGTPTTGFTLTQLNSIRTALMNASQFGVINCIPDAWGTVSTAIRTALVDQANRALSELNRRLAFVGPKLTTVFNVLNPNPLVPITAEVHKAQVSALNEIAQTIFGRSLRVFTSFTLHNQTQVQAASTYATNYPNFFADSGPFPVDSWMAGVARVRPRMGDHYKQMLLSESVRFSLAATSAFAYTKQTVLQLPVVDTINGTDQWIGMKLPPGYKIPKDAVSMIVESDGSSTVIPTCGIVIDEWAEQIPIDQVNTGIAINYDQPSSEAPQAIILAVTPEVKGQWQWEDLIDTLNETIDMAKIRAVEPDMIQETGFSQVLPALMAQMNGDGTNISPSLDFAKNVASVPNGFDNPIDLIAYPN